MAQVHSIGYGQLYIIGVKMDVEILTLETPCLIIYFGTHMSINALDYIDSPA